MALTPTIYRASLELAHVDRDVYAPLASSVARHPSETAERLVLRLLAWALCYEEGLAFTRGIAAGDEPELWRHAPDGRVELWVEVGLVEAERLRKAARHARRVVLLAAGANRWRWEAAQLPLLAGIGNLCVLGLDFALVQSLAAALQRSVSWSVTVSGGTLYVSDAGTTYEAPLEVLAGSWD